MNSSPRSRQEEDRGRGRDGLPGASPAAGDPDGANRTAAHDPWELRRPSRQAVQELRAGPTLPPGPQPSYPAPWLQSCTSSAGMAPHTNPFGEQSTASRRSASSEGKRAEADTPTRFSSPSDASSRTGDTCPSCLNKKWGSPADSVFSGRRIHRPLGSTPLGCFLIRCSLGGSGSPWRLHECCANKVRPGPPRDTALLALRGFKLLGS
uniref:Uncharacterized protein n=1 Tax=Mus musculus TaxID=10090 RepID=Q9D1W7_MOUSE|nr:unnamed protein product [Mus musculus]